MKSYLDLVPQYEKVHRKQSKMSRICIILAVFLVAVMFGLADMYLQGITQKVMQENGDWHYQITSIDTKTSDLIAARPEVEVSGWHSTISADAGYSISGQPIAISGLDEDVFGEIYLASLAEGKYPNAANEIAVSSVLKESNDLDLGSVIDLTCPDGSTVSFSIVGFFDNPEKARLIAGSEQSVILAQEGFTTFISAANSPASEKYIIQLSQHCDMLSTIEKIKSQYSLSDGQIEANMNLLNIEGQLAGKTGVNQIYSIALILSIIVMLTCILMISSTLNSNVTQRTEFFGMLRCLGATKKQIMNFVRLEGLYWCKTAISAGVALSIVVVWVTSAAMRKISPQWFAYMPTWGISWISIAVSVLLGLLTVLLAARTPAKKAAKSSPLEAVSGNAQQTTMFRKAANTSFFKIETAMGVHHAKSNKKNYVLMTGAFAICIVLFLTFSTLVNFMQNAFMPSEWTPELSIVSETNTCSIDSVLLENIKQNENVKRAYGRMFAYDVPVNIDGSNHKANVISYEANQFKWSADYLTAGSISVVEQEENQVLVVNTENTDVRVGDVITLSINGKEQAVTVAGILSDSPLAREEGTETIFCSEKTFVALTGQTGYTIIDVQFQNGASIEDVKDIENIFTDGGVVFTEQLSQVQQQRNLYSAFAVLVYGFLSIIVAITIFHIMNTINMGVIAKTKQYGTMRAIGMSNQQLIKMIVAEAMTYAVSGIILGCIIGLPMHWVVFASLITNFWGTAWSIPIFPLALIIGIVLFTSFLAVRSPAKRLHDMAIVDTIKSQQ